MITQRTQGRNYKQDTSKTSSRYEGIAEHNSSQYIILAAADDDDVQVNILPVPHAVHAFSQPAKIHTMSMTQAEQAIEDQRTHMTRYMLHQKTPGHTEAPSNSKHRLFGKLKALAKAGAGEDADDDDVMGDVKFATKKGSASRARKELLSSLAEGVAIDVDGVMGGTNDREFGGKRRFAKHSIESVDQKAQQSGPSNKGNDGMAMADDFYKRDVKAEYEELDYDANEQFDDDDVDHGEADVNFEGGFADELDDSDVDDDDEGEDDDKKEGLASVRGLKDMLARARGEAPTEDSKKTDEEEKGSSRPTSPATNAAINDNDNEKKTENDGLANFMAAAERHRENAQQKTGPKPVEKPIGVQVDETGQRIITLESVRYEIFLHNKVIQTKKLMKIFSIKKKSAPVRIKKFQSIIKELCNIVKDPVYGNMLKLKQHYSK